ncbi:MAG TPA: hypothetical protein VME24_08705 [Alphaproteobacteria bacterium]|nr:hypothetical protein [Alphaproteobacteria bacterium]
MTISRENPARFRASLNSAGFRCLVAAVATAVQVALFIDLIISNSETFAWTLPPRWLVWSWVAALDIGITFGCFGLLSARHWNERILALVLLSLQFLSLLILFRTGVFFYAALHGAASVH